LEKSLNRAMPAMLATALLSLLLNLPAIAQRPAADWIAASNRFTNQLLAVEMKHAPELGSNQGLPI